MSWNKETEGYRKRGGDGSNNMPKQTKEWCDDDTVEKVLKNTVYGPWEDAGISEEVMKECGVRVRYSEKSGPFSGPTAIYFPAYNADYSKVIGFQKKDLRLDKNAKYHFTNIGTINVKNPMFFQNLADTSANHVYLCEGPKDALCLRQCMKDNTKKEWQDHIPPIVSILLGCPNAKKNVIHNEWFLKNFKGEYKQKEEIKKKGPILCFDSDESLPGENEIKGREASEECAAFLRDYYVKILQHVDYVNDIGDYLKKDKSELLFKKAVFQTVEFRPEKIVSLYDVFKPGELKEPVEQGIYLPSYPKLMDMLCGERSGELTLFLAPSGAGKSSITADMLYETMVLEGHTCGIFLEENLKKTFQRFIARRMGVNLKNFRLGLCEIDDEKYQEAEKWVADPDRFLALNHSGSIKISQLESLAKLAIYKYGRKKIVFDHLTLSQPDQKGANEERLALDSSMKMLAALCEETDVSIKVICHINRNANQGRNREIKEPTWRRCFKEDARGSSAIECLSWNVICLDLEELANGKRGRVRLSLQKNREAGELGFADILTMDFLTGKMVDASDYVYDEVRGMVPPLEIGGTEY